ncbi:MAG: glycosyltransferase [bacterium]
MAKIAEYAPMVGQSTIDELRLLADRLEGRAIQHINSTAVGGGVAEILNRMVPLLIDLGVNTRWNVIKGGEKFFEVTKRFHNALHGQPEEISARDFQVFREATAANAERMTIDGDIVFVHDPQPLGLIERKEGNKWVWRCHIDVSSPNREVWAFLRDYIVGYDASVFSAPGFSRQLPIRQFLIAPSIDPLSDKNRELDDQTVSRVLAKYGIDPNRPIVTQISRFDRLKDPVGVIEAYNHVKRYTDCQLVLAGGTATDDPEGALVLEEVKEKAQRDADIHVLLLPQNDTEVNALQRASTVVVQKSIKEGFGLTVAEALWKSKPVVASKVGGIPLQVTHKYSGLLCHSVAGAAFAIKQLLSNPDYARRLGENGRQHVLNNFLVTRHLRDYLLVFLSLYHPEDIVYL